MSYKLDLVDKLSPYILTDIDECLLDNHCDNGRCVNMIGGFRCDCNEGFNLVDDGHQCQGWEFTYNRPSLSFQRKRYLSRGMVPLIGNVSTFIDTIVLNACIRDAATTGSMRQFFHFNIMVNLQTIYINSCRFERMLASQVPKRTVCQLGREFLL